MSPLLWVVVLALAVGAGFLLWRMLRARPTPAPGPVGISSPPERPISDPGGPSEPESLSSTEMPESAFDPAVPLPKPADSKADVSEIPGPSDSHPNLEGAPVAVALPPPEIDVLPTEPSRLPVCALPAAVPSLSETASSPERAEDEDKPEEGRRESAALSPHIPPRADDDLPPPFGTTGLPIVETPAGLAPLPAVAVSLSEQSAFSAVLTEPPVSPVQQTCFPAFAEPEPAIDLPPEPSGAFAEPETEPGGSDEGALPSIVTAVAPPVAEPPATEVDPQPPPTEGLQDDGEDSGACLAEPPSEVSNVAILDGGEPAAPDAASPLTEPPGEETEATATEAASEGGQDQEHPPAGQGSSSLLPSTPDDLAEPVPASNETPPLPAIADEPAAKPKRPRVPRRYQPQKRGTATAPRPRASSASGTTQVQPCPIAVRLRNQTGGSIILSLLPRRRSGLPASVEVDGAGSSPLALSALREEWYQEVVLAGVGAILQQGVEWCADGQQGSLRWSLSGRDLYVLGTSDDWSGYVSTPQLVLGDQHAVLCTQALLAQVEDLLRQSCGTLPARLDEDDGLPAGWFGFRPVVPTKPLALGDEAHILNALRPLPDVQIALRGGIRLRYGEWLFGHPPSIRIYGDAEHAGPLYIDGGAAARLADGSFSSPGWDGEGEHAISCAGQTKTYRIVEPEDGWEAWAAYTFSAIKGRALAPVCGGAVIVPGSGTRWTALIPASNPVVIGAQPGQVYHCPLRQDVRFPFCPASVPFEPVWALPADPLRADKRTARVRLVGTLQKPVQPASNRQAPRGANVIQWRDAILACSRKALAVDPDDGEAKSVWREYREAARKIWRAAR